MCEGVCLYMCMLVCVSECVCVYKDVCMGVCVCAHAHVGVGTSGGQRLMSGIFLGYSPPDFFERESLPESLASPVDQAARPVSFRESACLPSPYLVLGL